MRKNQGITLVALVITIIVLLILAGITITFMLGDNGILNRTKEAGMSYEEQAAKEKLEIALMDISADKITNPAYNEQGFINDRLAKEEMVVIGDIVIVDGWQFEIDRSVPKIGQSLGKGKQNEEIQITANAVTSSDYVKASIQVEIKYSKNISSITIGGNKIEVPTAVEGVYKVEQEVMENGTYAILVKDEEGNYKIAKVEVREITEDMDIWNKADMESFRDKVNSGRTFEGRSVRVRADIDLEGSASNPWTPIGNSTHLFKGTFDGNNHTIINIYINTTADMQGLFGIVEATIKNVVIDNSNIIGVYGVGAISGCIQNSVIENCHVKANVTVKSIRNDGSVVGGITGSVEGGTIGEIRNCHNEGTVIGQSNYVGGIIGAFTGTVKQCYNTGTVQSSTGQFVGGISGINLYDSIIQDCYNTGTILANNQNVGGITGGSHPTPGASRNLTIQNCYNVGSVTGTSNVGQIAGKLYFQSKIINCYYPAMGSILADKLGEAFIEDSTNINNGYPILKWQIGQ